MSIAVSDLIWKRSRHKGSNLLTLLALADWAADDGTSIYPSFASIARKVRLSVRATKYIVDTLVESGELSVESKRHACKNGGYTNCYTINIKMLKEAGDSAKFAPSTKATHGAKFAPPIVQPVAPPIVQPASANPSSDPSVREREDGEPMKARVAVAPQGAPAGIKSQPKPKTERQAERVEDAQKREPAILVYAQTFRQQPNAAQRLAILRQVTDVPKWGAVCQRWAVKGYKPGSVDKMLEVYEHGWRDAPGTNGTQPSGKQATVSEGRDGSVTITYG